MAAICLLLTACGEPVRSAATPSNVVANPAAGDRANLAGAGSTAVAPLFKHWIDQYRSVAPDVAVRYQLSGSDAGIRSVVAGDADFALSDVPLNAADRALGDGQHVAQVPVAGMGIAIAYNLPAVDELRLSPNTLANIFQGRITTWDDPGLRSDNRGVVLPRLPITVVHRGERSGTTGVLTRYLQQAASRSWTRGFARQVPWPPGVEVRGSEGMARAIKGKVGAIGYLAAGYLEPAQLRAALVANFSGNYVAPTTEAVAATLSASIGNDRDLSLEVPLTDAPAGYPIAGFAYLLFRPEGNSPEVAALNHFAEWVLRQGQSAAEQLGYVPLPLILRMRTLDGLSAGGVPVKLREDE